MQQVFYSGRRSAAQYRNFASRTRSRHDARADLCDCIVMFYNPRRRLSHIGGISPGAFERTSNHGLPTSVKTGEPNMSTLADIFHSGTGTINDIAFSLILILGAALIGFVIHYLVNFILKKWHKRNEPSFKGLKLELGHLKAPLRLLIPAICIAVVLPFVRLPRQILTLLIHLVDLWIIGAAGWLLVRIVSVVRDLALSRYKLDEKDNLEARRVYTQIRVIQRILVVIILFVTLASMLLTFEKVRQIGVSLLASAGIIGIILGFAAQKTLGNLLAGIQIAFAQPIRLDDVVIVENEWGWVEEITLTYVVIRIWDLRRLIIPISYFIEKPFQNWTRISADLLGTVYLYADYTVPVEEIRRELFRILEKSEYWDGKVKGLQVTDATDRTVELRALMSAADSPTAWNLRCEVREELLAFIQEKYPEGLPQTRVRMEKDQERSNSADA
jgi:small-conductance mechanosensitive channel